MDIMVFLMFCFEDRILSRILDFFPFSEKKNVARTEESILVPCDLRKFNKCFKINLLLSPYCTATLT